MFSVIMPCYNSQAYIRGAIDSVINQTYPDWELIAINDGSTDDTLAILEEYAKSDARIKVFSKPNGGYVSAVNFGLEKVMGAYFLMMGSDDALSSTLFSQLNDALFSKELYPDCIAWRTVQVIDGVKSDKAERITDFQGEVCEFNISFAAYTDKHSAHAEIFSCRDTSKCYKTELLGELRYFGQYGYDADGIFSMLLCHRARSFASIPYDGYFWTLRSDSLSGKKPSYSTNIDRIKNWTRFYTVLANFDTAEITAAEKRYLNHFLSVVQVAWEKSSPIFCDYKIIRKATGLIKKMSKLTEYRFSRLSNKLVLYSPIVWKLLSKLKSVKITKGDK